MPASVLLALRVGVSDERPSLARVEFVPRSYFPTMTYKEQLELMERLATEVAPHV